jgi:hypothetical protein
MRVLFLLSFLVGFIHLPSFAQTSAGKEFYRKRIDGYSVMQAGGIVMTIAGAGVTTAGFLEWSKMGDEDPKTGSPLGEFITGGFLIIVGVPLLAGGTTLGVIGSVKKKIYKNKLKNLSFNLKYNNYERGLVLRYRF